MKSTILRISGIARVQKEAGPISGKSKATEKR